MDSAATNDHLKKKSEKVYRLVLSFTDQAQEHYDGKYKNEYLHEDFIKGIKQISGKEREIKNEINALDFHNLNHFEGMLTAIMTKIGMMVGDYAIMNSENPVITLGTDVIYRLQQNTPMLLSQDTKTKIYWYVENEDGAEKELEVNRNKLECKLKAAYTGTHLIKAKVYFDNSMAYEVVYAQQVVEGDPEILKLSHFEKMLMAAERSNVWDEIKNEIGDPKTLIASILAITAILFLIADTGFGLVAEVLAGIIAAISLGISVSNLYDGIVYLVEFVRISGYAGSQYDLDKAGDKFGKAVAKIGVNTLLALLSYLGAKKSFNNVKTRLVKINEGANKDISVIELIKAGDALERSGLTAAGRALQKHGNRSGSVFPRATGNTTVINTKGKTILNEILTNPNVVKVIRHHARFGNVLEYKIPGGQGARFSEDGKIFIGFIEP